MRAAGFIGGLAVVFGFVALPAHSDESVTVPVPLVDAMAVSHFESAKRQKEKPGSVILALHAVRRIPQDTVVTVMTRNLHAMGAVSEILGEIFILRWLLHPLRGMAHRDAINGY